MNQMSRLFTITLLLLFPSFLIAQVNFKSGYFIDKNKQKHDCLLLNQGIENKGEAFVYKVHKDSIARNFEISEVVEFGVPGDFRFIRNNILVDVSDNKISSLSDTLDHRELESGHAFLLELVNSELASLYFFFHEGTEFYFYKKENSDIQELVYKRYNVEDVSGHVTRILYDKTYQKQLALHLPCSASPKTIPYTRKALVKYFKKYLEENNGERTISQQKTKGQLLIKAAGMYSQMSFIAEVNDQKLMDFPGENGFGYGLEVEYLIRYNRNKLGVFVEATYGEYSSTFQDPYTDQISGINYEFVEIPIGVSYRFNLSEDFRLVLKAGLVPNVALSNSSMYLYRESNTKEITSSTNGLFSFGLNYKRLNAEVRMYTNRNITQSESKTSEFSQFSGRLSYTIFNFKGK